MISSLGLAATAADAPLSPWQFQRRPLGEQDVLLDLLYCGVCHSDIHFARNEWGRSRYPVVPGHEIVGRVSQVGAGVSNFNVGDLAAIGSFVDSCRHCPACESQQQQYCHHYPTLCFGSRERKDKSVITQGGYSNNYVIDSQYCLKVPANLDPASVAPLLCAGITTYSPLRRWQIGPGSKVGVVGLGGLGHMAIKFAHAFGAEVTLFTTSANKAADAARLGASAVVLSNDAEALKAAQNFDFILDTVAARHDINSYLKALRPGGTLCLVGMPDNTLELDPSQLLQHKFISGSMIGGLAETQEMLDYCGKHNIAADIELIRADQVNEAFDRVVAGQVKYRFVIDLATLTG